MNKGLVDRLLYREERGGGRVYEKVDDILFCRKQKRLLMANNLFVDPVKIEDYIVIGGYQALCKVLSEMKPEQVIEVIKKSG